MYILIMITCCIVVVLVVSVHVVLVVIASMLLLQVLVLLVLSVLHSCFIVILNIVVVVLSHNTATSKELLRSLNFFHYLPGRARAGQPGVARLVVVVAAALRCAATSFKSLGAGGPP